MDDDYLYWGFALAIILVVIIVTIVIWIVETPFFSTTELVYIAPYTKQDLVVGGRHALPDSRDRQLATLSSMYRVKFSLTGTRASFSVGAGDGVFLYGLPDTAQMYIGVPPSNAITTFEYYRYNVVVPGTAQGWVGRGNNLTLMGVFSAPSDTYTRWVFVPADRLT